MLSSTVLLAIGPTSTGEQPVATEVDTYVRSVPVEDVESSRVPTQPTAPVEIFPLPPGTVFERDVVLGEGAYETAGVTEQLIYSNTLGTFGAALGTGNLVADDITTTVPTGCKLRRYEFPVIGKVDPAGLGGPYTVDFAMYTNCPGSVPNSLVPGLIIPGTQGQRVFPDDAPRLISFVAPASVSLPTNLWFGVKFSRNNAGVVVGEPPLTGFSCDQIDFPGFPCNAYLGGFPGQPQASFNLEIYADSACANSFTGYKNSKPSGSTFNPGATIFLADDIQLSTTSCNMIAYEVAVRGQAFYTFRMQQNCESDLIAGTERVFTVFGVPDVKIARFTFDPPIPLPQNLWFTAKVNNDTGGMVIAGQQACIGVTADLLSSVVEGVCTVVPPEDVGVGIHGAFNLAITCAGPAPVGACCDMFITDENGDAVCREVPKTNCPFPERFTLDRPVWVQGEVCEPDPFTPFPCGKAACCTPGGGCTNLTRNECYAVPPLDWPRKWDLGQYCNSQGQRCPRNPCLGRTGECTTQRCLPNSGVCDLTTHTCSAGMIGQACTSNSQCHCPYNGCQVSPTCCDSCPPIGCGDVECCNKVCDQDIFCCAIEWDQTCADEARQMCGFPLVNDRCEGAREMTTTPPNNTAETDSGRAKTDSSDPGFGCYAGNPGATGLQTVWYKFVATHTTALLQTCFSNSPATDSLINVFAVGDPTSPLTQCDSLIPVGCSDDFPGCSSNGKNSKLCVRTVPGDLYYVLVASKIALNPGTAYRLDITGGAFCEIFPLNDYCPYALLITDGMTAFNLAVATMTVPIETCIPTMINDLWYNYTATCSGMLTVEACGAVPGTTTNLAIYEGGQDGECLCPPTSGPPINCRSALEGPNCGPGSKLEVDVVEESCYGIRLADDTENRPSGNLKIACTQTDCPAGPFTFTDPPNGVVDAARPHDPNNAALLQGIQTIKATGPRDALASCFTLCETTSGGPLNSIASVVQDPTNPCEYTIILTKSITAGELTTITYTDTHSVKSTGRFTSHPGNIRADATTSAADVTDLLALLNGIGTPVWDDYSRDINRSGLFTPADLLEEIDLMTDDGPYDPPVGGWDGSLNQSTNPICP